MAERGLANKIGMSRIAIAAYVAHRSSVLKGTGLSSHMSCAGGSKSGRAMDRVFVHICVSLLSWIACRERGLRWNTREVARGERGETLR